MSVYLHIIQNKRSQCIRRCKAVSKTCCQIDIPLLRGKLLYRLRNDHFNGLRCLFPFIVIIIFSLLCQFKRNVITDGFTHLLLPLLVFDR